jgi:hypothetical protein
MIKTLHLQLPEHIRKFFMFEYNGYQKKNGHLEIKVDKNSELGKLIHLISRPIPFTQKSTKASPATLSIRYYTHVQSFDVPAEKISLLIVLMDEMFRRTMIHEVRGAQELVGCDYGPLVTAFLKRRGIEKDVDVDWQKMRKVYRDYVRKTNRKMEKIYA